MENTKNANHQLVYSDLVNAILEKKFAKGDWLPSENELCEKYNISRPTVRIALSRLVSEGYIQKNQGKGSQVIFSKKALGILSVTGTTSGLDPDFELITEILSKPVLTPWPSDFSFDISFYIQNKIDCIYLKRERKLLNQTIICEDTYLPNIGIDGIMGIDFENKSLFKTLFDNFGIQVKGGQQRFKAKITNEIEAEELKIFIHQPILYIEREIHTNKNDFIFFSILKCNTEKYFLEGSF